MRLFQCVCRDKITGTISDTLRRKDKRKKSKANNDIPNFLFVNKPHFSSEESLPDASASVITTAALSADLSYSSPSETSSRQNHRDRRDTRDYREDARDSRDNREDRDRGKRYRSELMLRIPSRFVFSLSCL